MKKIYFIIITILLTGNISAQKNKKQQTDIIPYDSISNFLGRNATAYTGQELFLKGLSKSDQSYGYSGFILKYKKDDGVLNDEKNIYKPNENYNSRYEDLAHKYFYVQEVIQQPRSDNNDTDFYLKLKELSGGDILYYKYDVNSEYTFPFIVRGYFEKQRQLKTGNEYILSDNIMKMSRNLITGNALAATTGQTWKCIDVNIDNTNNELSMVFQNPQGIKTAIAYSLLDDSDGIKKMYTADEAKTLTRKYNSNNFRRILQNKIRVGMTKEMTRLAWGEPTDIKTNGKTEQWFYPAGKLTFTGDKITSTK